jgi:PAS domain-containing protein
MPGEHHFICPHCASRSLAADRQAGFTTRTRGCEKCGFAYLFELLDDYYPAPNSAFFACDSQGRIVDCGRGSFELTGLKTERAIGQPIAAALGLRFADGQDAVATALEWEVSVKAKPVEMNVNGNGPVAAIADIFPAYDDPEGGLLVVLTPAGGR